MFQIDEVVIIRTGKSKNSYGTILYRAHKNPRSSCDRWAVWTSPNKLKLINEDNLGKVCRKLFTLNDHLKEGG